MPSASVATRERIIARAESQLGVNESPAYSNRTPYTAWYGMVGPWCAMFVSWCFYLSGLPLRITTEKGFAYCPYGVTWFKRQGKWAGPNVRPERGWVVFFDFIGRPSHVGIVQGVAPDGRIITLEGNTNASGSRTGGAVMRHHRRVSSGIIGYGIVDYIAQPAPSPTPGPAPTPEPDQPKEEDAMLGFIRVKNTAEVYLIEGQRYTHVLDGEQLTELAAALGISANVADLSQAQFNLLIYGRTKFAF